MKSPTPRMQMSMEKKSRGLLAVVMFDMLMICLFTLASTLVYRVKFFCVLMELDCRRYTVAHVAYTYLYPFTNFPTAKVRA
jgi:hypothetical protein